MPDVFISYTHNDNRVPRFQSAGWVVMLQEALQIALRQLYDRDATVWFDERRIEHNDDFDAVIEAELRATKLFLAVLSPDYMRSAACAKELRCFREACEQGRGLKVDASWRLLKVVKHPQQDGSIPLPDIRSTGFSFYTMTDRAPLVIDPTHGVEAAAEFARRVNDLAHAAWKTLSAFDGAEPPVQQRRIYLAETASDVRDVRNTLRRELEGVGHVVMPHEALPYTREYAAAVRHELATADVAIVLVGKEYGLVPEGEARSIVDVQEEAVADEARRRPSLRTITWLQPGARADDDGADPGTVTPRRAFFTRLRDRGTAVAMSLDDLRDAVRAALEPAPAGHAGTVFVAESTFDVKDQRDALCAELVQRGYAILPDAPLPYAPGYDVRVREQLDRARVSVHPLGRRRGIVPEGATADVCEIAYDAAGARAVAVPPFARLVWLCAGPSGVDERRDAFFARVQQESRIIGGPGGQVMDAISAALSAGDQPRQPAGHRRRVFLIYAEADEPAIGPVRTAIEADGHDVVLPLFDGDEAQLRVDLEETIDLSDGVLIYYGRTTELWKRAKERDVERARGRGRTRDFLALGVLYTGAPDGKRRVERRPWLDLDGFGTFEPRMLAPFLALLRRAQHEAS